MPACLDKLKGLIKALKASENPEDYNYKPFTTLPKITDVMGIPFQVDSHGRLLVQRFDNPWQLSTRLRSVEFGYENQVKENQTILLWSNDFFRCVGFHFTAKKPGYYALYERETDDGSLAFMMLRTTPNFHKKVENGDKIHKDSESK